MTRHGSCSVSDLTQILAIDPVARTCTAESGVMFADVVAATLRHGLVPLVVPELASITVGGAVSGRFATAAFTTRASSTRSSPRPATCCAARPTTSTRSCSR
ncbi:MAG: FAD-binding protein [Acidobacteriota bacterium]